MAFNVIRTNNSLQARHSTLIGPVLEHKTRVRPVFHYGPQSIDSSNPQSVHQQPISVSCAINRRSTPIQFINTLFVSCAINRQFNPQSVHQQPISVSCAINRRSPPIQFINTLFVGCATNRQFNPQSVHQQLISVSSAILTPEANYCTCKKYNIKLKRSIRLRHADIVDHSI